MLLTPQDKQRIKREVVAALRQEREIRKIVVFGSFVSSNAPNDLDIAIFQNSDEKYLPLALKYRRLLRPVAPDLPLDVVPIRPSPQPCTFLTEILKGETLYEH